MDDFKLTPLKAVGMVVFALVVFAALAFASGILDLASFSFFAPRYATVQRKVYEETPSYVNGKAEYLTQLRFQYQAADAGHKAGLRTLILSEAATVDSSKLPLDLQSFIETLKEKN